MELKSWLSSFLTITLVAFSPGLPAYTSAAHIVRGGSANGILPGAAQAWIPLIEYVNFGVQVLQLKSGVDRSDLTHTLGHIRFKLQTNPNSTAALAFLEHLNRELQDNPQQLTEVDVKTFAEILDAQIGPAIQTASKKLESRAEELLFINATNGLTPEQKQEVRELSDAWFYLKPETGKLILELASQFKEEKPLGLARSIAYTLAGKAKPFDASPAAFEAAELQLLFHDVSRLLPFKSMLQQPEAAGNAQNSQAFVQEVLAPYAGQALDLAARRMEERGLDGAGVYRALLEYRTDVLNHMQVFGKLAGRKLVKALRASGEWTEFVAALSLKAAQRLGQVLGPDTAGEFFREVSANHHLRLPIPAWHDLYKEHETVAGWLKFTYGFKTPRISTDMSILIFKAFGIPVRVDPSLLFMLAMIIPSLVSNVFPAMAPGLESWIYWVQTVVSAVLLYVSIIAHEFGHALMARLFGVRTHEIMLFMFGGVAAIDHEPRQSPAEFLVAVAGPIVSLALILLTLWGISLAAGFPIIAPVLLYVAEINMMLVIFNLIPAFPMDGGRVLRAILAGTLGDHYQATRIAASFGRAFSYVLSGYGILNLISLNLFGILYVLIGMFIHAQATLAGLHPGTNLVDPKPERT